MDTVTLVTPSGFSHPITALDAHRRRDWDSSDTIPRSHGLVAAIARAKRHAADHDQPVAVWADHRRDIFHIVGLTA